MWLYFKKTVPGLKLRAIGENPAAADSLGVNVAMYKYIHIIIGSGIMGLGGLYMGLNMGGTFEGSNCWINGYGWISIALVIFANWSPAKAILGTLIFGFFNTLRVQNAALAYTFPDALGWLTKIPSHFPLSFKYLSSLRRNSSSRLWMAVEWVVSFSLTVNQKASPIRRIRTVGDVQRYPCSISTFG